MRRFLFSILVCGLACLNGWASDFAPSVPELDLPADSESAEEPVKKVPSTLTSAPKSAQKSTKVKSGTTVKKPVSTARPKTTASSAPVIAVDTAEINKDLVSVEKVKNIDPKLLVPISQEPVIEPEKPAQTTAPKQPLKRIVIPAADDNAQDGNSFVPGRDTATSSNAPRTAKVVYNPRSDRDPTLSPDDTLLLKHREEERLRALEMERQRKIEAERQRLAELERQRQLELERLRDPSREVRGKIHINGIIGQEVFIGDKVYTVGKSVMGARIISVQPDAVEFIYKGQKFKKKVQLQ